jgi:hypothetical protein
MIGGSQAVTLSPVFSEFNKRRTSVRKPRPKGIRDAQLGTSEPSCCAVQSCLVFTNLQLWLRSCLSATCNNRTVTNHDSHSESVARSPARPGEVGLVVIRIRQAGGLVEMRDWFASSGNQLGKNQGQCLFSARAESGQGKASAAGTGM